MLNRLTCAEIQNGYCLLIASGAIQLGWLETRGS
jgi:hypothetical protein